MTTGEKDRIRKLAFRVAEIADKPCMAELRNAWKKHNSLGPTRPLVLVYPEGSWREILPRSQLECRDPKAREYEWKLLSRIYRHENFHDDMVIEKKWIVAKRITSSGWGFDVKRAGTATEFVDTWDLVTNVGGTPRVWDADVHLATGAGDYKPLVNGPEDLKKFVMPQIRYDEKVTTRDLEEAEELLGGILDVEARGMDHITYHLMQEYTELRGLTQMLLDMYDEPGLLHDMMDLLEQGHRKMLQQYVDLGLLSPNNNEAYHCTGGVGYTDELPSEPREGTGLTPKDLWAGSEAQETSQVSPDMFAEFILPHEKRLLEPFGLAGYGCCEDLTPRLEHVLTIPNLRRISISPWANVAACAQKIRDRYIFSWKPNPSMVVGRFNEQEIRQTLRSALEMTRDCRVEIILKDIHTVENEPERISRWTEIAQELVNR